MIAFILHLSFSLKQTIPIARIICEPISTQNLIVGFLIIFLDGYIRVVIKSKAKLTAADTAQG